MSRIPLFVFFSVLEKIIVLGYKALGLQYFFSAALDEVEPGANLVGMFVRVDTFHKKRRLSHYEQIFERTGMEYNKKCLHLHQKYRQCDSRFP